MEANAGYWEAKYNVFFTYASLARAVDLADRYVHDQFLPEKAIHILEAVAAKVGSDNQKQPRVLVTPEQVADVVSATTNIPLSQVTAAESQRLLHLEEDLHRRIIGQDEAVKFVVSAMQRARTELRDKKRPIASLLFLGPTGVGKTELSKALAQSYFGSEERMIRLDMSEYQQGDSVARLIGVPGSESGGLLTEAVRKQPFALVLLDEIEKAHPDILNIFLQVMEDGRLTDALGRTIDFTNIILIATSNASSAYIQEQVTKQIALETIKDSLIKDQLTKQFRAEFLNRFDGIVLFKPLTETELFDVAGLLLQQVAARLQAKGINLSITSEAQQEFAQQGFDPVFGARPLRRLIQDKVDNALAQYLLKGALGRRDKVILKAGGEIEVDKAEKFV
jgi:ATP-dependent Clp protease ATP-binding subunit ClpA